MEQLVTWNGIKICFTTAESKHEVQSLESFDEAEIVIGLDPAFGVVILKCNVPLTVVPPHRDGTIQENA